MKTKRLKVRISIVMFVLLSMLSIFRLSSDKVMAATTSSYSPYAKIEYSYSASVSSGTIRYISQVPGGSRFNSAYWPSSAFGSYSSPRNECGTACVSMALSYIGINKTPKVMLEARNGVTEYEGWGATYQTPSLSTGITNYLSGNGKYSPVMIHIPRYSTDGHFVLIVGKISDTSYQILDPWECQVSSMTINGTSVSYSKGTTVISDRIDSVKQWYNPNSIIGHNPQGWVDGVISNSPGTITVTGWAFDKDDPSRSIDVHVYVGGSASSTSAKGYIITANQGGEDVNSAYGITGKHRFNSTLKVSPSGSTDVYFYGINVGGGTNVLITHKTVNIQKDSEKPKITDIEITEITSEGYRITCTVTDIVQVSKVSFPTWTARVVNGTNQDDIKWGEGTLSGNKATFYVKRSDHNGEYGLYHNHIYAHDVAENITSVIAPSVTVPDPRLQNDSDSPVITSSFNGHKYEVYDLSLGWKAAKSFCEEHGGHLVTITDAEENEAVSQLIRQGSKGYYHIGCSDEASEGNWVWITGEQFSYNNWDPQGEPSGNTTENWAMIVSIDYPPNKQFGEWVDMPEKAEDVGYYNYANSGFVCEYETEERELADCQITLDEEEFNYTGTEKEPSITVRYGDSLLSEGTDYYVSYSKNVNAGDAIVTVTGMGDYVGFVNKSFKINKAYQMFAATLSSPTVMENGVIHIDHNGIGTVTFESMDEDIATVNERGEIVGVRAGTTTINVTASGDMNHHPAETSIGITVEEEEPVCVHVSFDGGERFSSDLSQYAKDVIPGDAYGNLPIIAMNGYEMLGWYTEADGGEQVTESSIVDSYTDHILYAHWEAITRQLSFDTNMEGVENPQPIPVTFDEMIGMLPAVSCEGYSFDGWFDSRNRKVTEDTICDFVADTTVYAHWTQQEIHVHSYTSMVTKEPTCTEKGERTYSCSCGDIYTEDIPANGHTEEILEGKDASCTETGLTEGKWCPVCEKVLRAQETIPLSPHKEEIITGREATCTASGLTDGKKCSVCGNILVQQTSIPAKGHTWNSDYTTDKAATYTETGKKSIHCKICNAVKEGSEMEIPVLEQSEDPSVGPTPAVTGFSDVQDPSHPYYKAIYWAAEEGITKGYSDGTFGINRSCTRGEMMMFLWKYARKPAPKYTSKSPFKDVSNSHAFYKAILWGYQKGITKGYSDGSFGIDRNVSRGEAMMFLWKLKGRPAPQTASKSPFKDVPTTHAFYKAILWGSQNGITKGYTTGPDKGKFGINDNCTRGQIVTFLYKAR